MVSSPGWFNDEKNGDRKSRWTVPLTYTYLDKIGLEMGVLMFVTAHVMMSDSVELKNLKKTNTFMILLLNIQCVLNIYCRMELAK